MGIQYEVKHLWNGTDIDRLSDDQVIAVIEVAAKQIEELKKVSPAPQRIKALVAEREAELARFVARLDETSKKNDTPVA